MSFFANRNSFIFGGVLASILSGCGGPSQPEGNRFELSGDSSLPDGVEKSEIQRISEEKQKAIGESSYTLNPKLSGSWSSLEGDVNALVSKIYLIGKDDNPNISVPAKMAKISRLVDAVDISELSQVEQTILKARISAACSEAAQNFFASLSSSGQIDHPSQRAREQVKLKAWASR